MFLACHNLLQNFSAATPNHHCRTELHENDSMYIRHLGNMSAQDLLKVFIPMDLKNKTESCFKYTKPAWHFLGLNDMHINDTEIEREPCTDGWQYDIVQPTIVTEWDLVCDLRPLKQIGQSVYMSGLLLGAMIFGGLSDRFGRKAVMLWCCLQLGISGTSAALSTSFTAYCIFRFLVGMAGSGITLNASSLVVEWVPDKCRAITGSLGGYFFTFGQLVLAGLAYAIQNWRWLQFAVTAPYFVLFVVLWWSPESARWLVLNNKSEVAVKQLKQVAKINGKKEEVEKVTAELVNSSMQMELQAAKITFSIVDLVRTAGIRKISFCVSLLWFSTGFAYYALAMDLQDFGFNIYLIQVIFGVIDIPFKLLSTTTINFIGRRFNQSTCLILPGLAIISSIFIPEDQRTVRTVLATLSKGLLAAAFTCCFLYTSELYPTVIRQTGIGLGATLARAGSMVAPLVKMLGDYNTYLPAILFGIAPIVSGLAICFLPETKNVPLPDSIKEVQKRSRRKENAKLKKEEVALEELETPLFKNSV